MGKNIHWFPGHMQKALRKIKEALKNVDVVIELSDARAPESSRNKLLLSLIEHKPHLLVLTKEDLADKAALERYTASKTIISGNLYDQQFINRIKAKINEVGEPVFARQKRRGMKRQPLNALVLGIPNVGKSTFINRLARENRASVANRPGHTRGQQYIKVSDDLALIDTPGVLEPNYADKTITMHLALIGTIPSEILPTNEMAEYLLTYLKAHYFHLLQARYKLSGESLTNHETLKQIASVRNFVGEEYEQIERAENLLLHEFKNGLIGRVSLE